MLVLAAAWLGMTDSRCPTLFATPPERLQAAWHEERQLTAAGPSMAEVFCLCSLSVCRSPSLPQGPEGGAEAGTASCSAAVEEEAGGAWGYEVLVQQDMDDGRDHGHEEAHAVATLRLQVWLCPPSSQLLAPPQHREKPCLSVLAAAAKKRHCAPGRPARL